MSIRRRSRASHSASATRSTLRITNTTTMMSNARTTDRAASSRSAGISWIVPKPSGNVTPSAVPSRWASTPGASGADRSGSWISGGMSPADCNSVRAAPTTGKTATWMYPFSTVTASGSPRNRRMTWVWANPSVCTNAAWIFGFASATWSRLSIPSRMDRVNVPARGLATSGSRVSIRAWTSRASTTCVLIFALSGAMNAGSSVTRLTSVVKRSVLRATWCVQNARVVIRIDTHASTATRPARTDRRRACVSTITAGASCVPPTTHSPVWYPMPPTLADVSSVRAYVPS